MFKNKIIILSVILIALVISIILVVKNNSFKPPRFDENAKSFEKVPDEEKVVKFDDNYAFYIEGSPKIKDNYIYINFYSLSGENTYLKVRILQDDNIIAESGLLKSNEYIEKVKINKSLSNSKKITYLIMSYEKDTYYSLGEIRLNSTLEE